MDGAPKSAEKIRLLLRKAVDIPNPLTVHIGEEVQIDRISGRGVRIYPGCRITGAKTVISAGCQLGAEAPATVDNCLLGPQVELRGGFFSNAVFLEKARMGIGAQVREGTILEEDASAAQSVGLKQTILFPFVTLGSLINFCDCLMAGGTSRRNHSEVGSSYVHFNYTPNQDKATASLIGDVPRGVMLNQPPIFLGGQGGMVGPLRIGYGNVVAAGTILRRDCPEENRLITAPASVGKTTEFIPGAYPDSGRVLGNNVLYLANLAALEAWYLHVRESYFAAQEFGVLVSAGARELLTRARQERLTRLRDVAETLLSPSSPERQEQRQAFSAAVRGLEGLVAEGIRSEATDEAAETFLLAFHRAAGSGRGSYIEAIRELPPAVSAQGVTWLNRIVADWCAQVSGAVPALNLFT